MTLETLFEQTVAKKASDLHLIVGHPPVFRIDGNLVPSTDTPALTARDMEGFVSATLTAEDKKRFQEMKDFDFAKEWDGARFRINLHMERGRIGLAARLIPSVIPTMDDLGMPAVASQLARLANGLLLVTGPTGSGKSTSLAAMIELINTERTANIMTIEDPIEFVFTSKKSVIKQRQLGSDVLSFTQGLKHVLRQDPDVIMVGEMRDLETIAAAMTIAETGHLVLATLHTPNAAQTIDRIIDVFPPYQQMQIRLQLALSLRGVIAQQLLPKIGGGRVAAREVMLNSPAVAHLIRENKTVQLATVMQTGSREGMVTFTQDLRRLMKAELVTKEDAAFHMVGGVVDEK